MARWSSARVHLNLAGSLVDAQSGRIVRSLDAQQCIVHSEW